MPRRIHKPAFPLSQYVEFMWRREEAVTESSRRRVCPDGAMALVMNLRRPTASFFVDGKTQNIPVPLLAGPWSRPFEIDPSQAEAAIGVVFRPGAARMFFPVPAHELHNADIALRDVHGEEADRLLNEVCSAAGEREQLLEVERYLRRKLRGARPVHRAVRYAVEQLSREGGVRRIGEIQGDTGLSHTRFIQLFRENVGLTPKLFCRVRRFRALLSRIGKGLPVNWAGLAADCGYFDQAHLIHDFRGFAGITPAEYSRALSEAESRRAAAAS